IANIMCGLSLLITNLLLFETSWTALNQIFPVLSQVIGSVFAPLLVVKNIIQLIQSLGRSQNAGGFRSMLQSAVSSGDLRKAVQFLEEQFALTPDEIRKIGKMADAKEQDREIG